MVDIKDLVGRAERLAARDGIAISTISRKILNDGKGLNRLKAGGQCTIKTLGVRHGSSGNAGKISA